MLELNSVEVTFKLAHLSAVRVHHLFHAVPVFADLLFDELGVAITNEALDPEGQGYTELVDEGFVLGSIVGGLVVDL